MGKEFVVAFPNGFSYLQGPWELRLLPVSSVSTFAKRNPVFMDGSGRVAQFVAGADSIVGIAMSDSSQSESVRGVNHVLVGIPQENTVFVTKVQTGVAASSLTAGQAYNIELNAEHFRLDVDSTTSKIVRIVPRGDGSSDALSVDSTVYVQFTRNVLKPYGSIASFVTPA